MISDISDLRNEYKKKKLSRSELLESPIEQFGKWLKEARNCRVAEPTAMTLATVDKNNQPSARIVLLKFVNENGFAFFTNYQSRKGTELNENPKAALVFFWSELERQVRIVGKVTKLDVKTSDEYFDSRPEQSRISAIISPQSRPVENREFLEEKVKDFISSKREIKRPENWGGFILRPTEIEFWQGRANRLHDRFQYKKTEEFWHLMRLAP